MKASAPNQTFKQQFILMFFSVLVGLFGQVASYVSLHQVINYPYYQCPTSHRKQKRHGLRQRRARFCYSKHLYSCFSRLFQSILQQAVKRRFIIAAMVNKIFSTNQQRYLANADHYSQNITYSYNRAQAN